uniref:Reverse transcriptase domain-containing protein n=1 Tax=Plectus sambesii TaxID=2011161 RepID=A0A914X171_9BILA
MREVDCSLPLRRGRASRGPPTTSPSTATAFPTSRHQPESKSHHGSASRRRCKTTTHASSSRRAPPPLAHPRPPCSTLPFLTSEVRAAVEGIPQGKAPGTDGITAELLKACGHPLFTALASRFSRYLHDGVIPKMWHTSRTIILFKKGDREDLANYQPITLLSVIYKVFTRCVLARIRRTLEEAQPVEQAGFRRSFSTMDHIATVQHLLEVSREHQSPLVLTFIDYEKAFDSVEPECVWESLRKQGVEEDYVHILQECYDGCTTTFIPFQREVPVAVGKGSSGRCDQPLQLG